jgi:pantetheine-phosphate adenylyltransferase
MEKLAICPGTYDPITEGHKDVIIRCAKVFDKVIIAVTGNIRKKPLYSINKRLEFVKRTLKDLGNIEIIEFNGLLIELARERKAQVIVKGLRAISDFEYEFQMAQINKKLNPYTETMFLVTNPKYAYLSSSSVKEVASFGGCINGLVPEEIEEDIIKSFKSNNFN